MLLYYWWWSEDVSTRANLNDYKRLEARYRCRYWTKMAPLKLGAMPGFLEVVVADRNPNEGCSCPQARLMEAISLVAWNVSGGYLL